MEKQSSCQIERIDTLAQLDELEKEWTNLVTEIPMIPVFLTWEWIRTWWELWGQDRELWLLSARDRQGKLLGLAPLMVEIARIGLLKIRVMAFIGSGLVSPLHLNIIAPTALQEELLHVFEDYLLSHANRWDVINFTYVAKDSILYGQLIDKGGRLRTGRQKIAPYIALPDDWETYQKTLTKKLKRNLRYFHAKLEDDYPGQVLFGCVTEDQELNSKMERLEELNKIRWHDKGAFTAFDDPVFSIFHQKIAGAALNHGWLRLYTLTVMDRIIGLFYCFRIQDRFYAYQMAFDTAWSEYSPGRLLIAYGIQEALREGVSELDWGPGEDEYKFAWTDQVRVEEVILLSHNWRGRFWIRSVNFMESIKMKAKELLPITTQKRIKLFLSGRYKAIEDRSAKDVG